MRAAVALLLAACTGRPAPAPDPAERAALEAALAFPVPLAPNRAPRLESLAREPGYTVEHVAFRVFEVDGRPFSGAAALYRPDRPGGLGVLVAHGHFGQGKSSAEAQEIAHRLARRRAVVLAVDTPGVEEWDLPGRRIHFAAGAHARAFLAAAGTSAMALQVAVLRAALDVLEAEPGVRRIAATGASGGAVQALYLLLADRRVSTAVLAAFPPVPREARASGCPCDQLPGLPGPRPGLLALVDRPTLWLADTERPRPEGLPRSARFEVLPGPHSYTGAMQRRALRWLLGRRPGDLEPVPALDLAGAADPAEPGILDLPLHPELRWHPEPVADEPFEVRCARGDGPAVVVAGGGRADRAALRAAGLRPCAVRVPPDDAGIEEGIATGRPYADRLAGAVRSAARSVGARAAWGVRAWGIVVAATGLDFVVRDPVRTLGDLDPDRDPAWVHVPGAWWGTNDALLGRALAAGDDPEVLAAALAERLTGGGGDAAAPAAGAPPRAAGPAGGR